MRTLAVRGSAVEVDRAIPCSIGAQTTRRSGRSTLKGADQVALEPTVFRESRKE